LGKDVEVVGVSGDTPEGQKLFKSEKALPFSLLADDKGVIAKKFGIPAGKGGVYNYKDAGGQVHMLKRGVTISRYHVVIDRQGNIADIAPVKAAADDAKRVCEIVEKLPKK
jgi:peroxiredoxin